MTRLSSGSSSSSRIGSPEWRITSKLETRVEEPLKGGWMEVERVRQRGVHRGEKRIRPIGELKLVLVAQPKDADYDS